jgi:5-formyltetrahydrofolate cyclo-ligase
VTAQSGAGSGIGNAMFELERWPPAAAKDELRHRLVQRRQQRSPRARRAAAAELATVAMAVPQITRARTVAAYIAVGSEPPTRSLLDVLTEGGTRILLPILRPDGELDWAAHDGRLARGAHGLSEPVGRQLGVDALAEAEVTLVPALAVARDGVRLGRGGGAYDRALAHAPGVPTWAMVYADEVLDWLPREPHDRLVAAAITPAGTVTLGEPTADSQPERH